MRLLSLPAGSGAGETDAVLALSERVSGLVETDAVPALSERVSGLVETDAVPALLEIDAVRVQKRCIDPGTGDVRRVIDSGRLRGVAHAAAATAGESEGAIALLDNSESANAKGPASAASSRVCPVTSSAALSAAVVHACSTPIHNSCPDTVSNSLWVERCRKVRTVGNRSVVQTVDMSPAPDAGTYRRSADKVHDQRQVLRKRQAESSGGGPGPGPGVGPGGRSGLVGGSLDRAAAFRGFLALW